MSESDDDRNGRERGISNAQVLADPDGAIKYSLYISAVYVNTVAEPSQIHRLLDLSFSVLSLIVSRIRFPSTGTRSSCLAAVDIIRRS